MILNTIGFLLFLFGTALSGFGIMGMRLYLRHGGDVVWLLGLNGGQALMWGVAILFVALATFNAEYFRRRLRQVENKLDILTRNNELTAIVTNTRGPGTFASP